jgi:hypothetical protein
MSTQRTLKNYDHILDSFADRAFYYKIIGIISIAITYVIISCMINIAEVNRMSKVVTTDTAFYMNIANPNIFTTIGLLLVTATFIVWVVTSFGEILAVFISIVSAIILTMIAVGPLVSASQETRVQNWVEEVTHSQIDHQKTEELNIVGSYKMSNGSIIKKNHQEIDNKHVITLTVEEKGN